jgi:hypothetical protein
MLGELPSKSDHHDTRIKIIVEGQPLHYPSFIYFYVYYFPFHKSQPCGTLGMVVHPVQPVSGPVA